MTIKFYASMTGNFGECGKWDWKEGVPVIITAEIRDDNTIEVKDWSEEKFSISLKEHLDATSAEGV